MRRMNWRWWISEVEKPGGSRNNLTEKEKQDLAQFYQQKQINNEPIKHGQRKWALIWWEV